MLFENETHPKLCCPPKRHYNTVLWENHGELLRTIITLKNTSEATTNHTDRPSILIVLKNSKGGISVEVFSSPYDAIAERDGSVAIMALFVKLTRRFSRALKYVRKPGPPFGVKGTS